MSSAGSANHLLAATLCTYHLSNLSASLLLDLPTPSPSCITAQPSSPSLPPSHTPSSFPLSLPLPFSSSLSPPHHPTPPHTPQVVTEASVRFLEAYRRYNYTTPKSYLELIGLYKLLLNVRGRLCRSGCARMSCSQCTHCAARVQSADLDCSTSFSILCPPPHLRAPPPSPMLSPLPIPPLLPPPCRSNAPSCVRPRSALSLVWTR